MAEKLKIIPLGGLNEIGKNMTVFEFGGEIIVVDCGMAFPGDDMYGIDCVIPDVSYLVKNKSRLRGQMCIRDRSCPRCARSWYSPGAPRWWSPPAGPGLPPCPERRTGPGR